jgi:hypothetical protein
LEVHVDEWATQADLSRELADVDAFTGKRRHDPQAVWVGQRREQAHEVSPGRTTVDFICHM